MFDKLIKNNLLFYSVVTIMIALMLVMNILLPYFTIWNLVIIPNLLLIIKHPYWKVSISAFLSYSLFNYTLSYLYEGEKFADNHYLASMLVGTVVNLLLISVLTYYRLENYKLIKKLEEAVLTDSLTGVYNRRYFSLYLNRIMSQYNPDNKKTSMILLDIDHFKNINDIYGHPYGDKVLKVVAEIIHENIRESDSLIRLGGEEFAVILPRTDENKAREIADRIRSDIRDHSFIISKDNHLIITVSGGIAEYKGESEQEFYNKADEALYKAKENGRNNII